MAVGFLLTFNKTFKLGHEVVYNVVGDKLDAGSTRSRNSLQRRVWRVPFFL
jgi:hypothetical protein